MFTWSKVPAFSLSWRIFFSFEAASLAFCRASFNYLSTLHLAESSRRRWTSSSSSLKFSSSDFSFFSSIIPLFEEGLWPSGTGLDLNPADAFDFMAVPSLCYAVPLIAVPNACLGAPPPALPYDDGGGFCLIKIITKSFSYLYVLEIIRVANVCSTLALINTVGRHKFKFLLVTIK